MKIAYRFIGGDRIGCELQSVERTAESLNRSRFSRPLHGLILLIGFIFPAPNRRGWAIFGRPLTWTHCPGPAAIPGERAIGYVVSGIRTGVRILLTGVFTLRTGRCTHWRGDDTIRSGFVSTSSGRCRIITGGSVITIGERIMDAGGDTSAIGRRIIGVVGRRHGAISHKLSQSCPQQTRSRRTFGYAQARLMLEVAKISLARNGS